MALAGKGSALKKSGASSAMANEPMTSLGGGAYQITSTARRVVDPAVAVVVEDAAVPVASNLWRFDYLFGIVTFSGYSPGGAITVDANYLATADAAEVRSVALSMARDQGDDTVMGDAARSKLPLLKDLTGSASVLAHPSVDWLALMNAGTPVLLEFRPASTGEFFRAWVLVSGFDEGATFDGLVETTVNFEGASRAAATDGDGAAFGWGS